MTAVSGPVAHLPTVSRSQPHDALPSARSLQPEPRTVRVLALSQSFAPGFRGGSIQALTYMVARLGSSCEFWVISRDRDPRQPTRLPGVAFDKWTTRGLARVFYSTRPHRPVLLARLIAEAAPDVVFVNSLFAGGSIALQALRRAGRVQAPVVVAPEGELALGALAQKTGKKRAYLRLAQALGLLSGVTWMARDAAERSDITREFPDAAPVVIVPCLGPSGSRDFAAPLPKIPGTVTLLYLSRITPKKNLAFLIQALGDDTVGELDLDIVGPVDDERYWRRCQEAIAQLPSSVRVRYHGEAMPDDVPGWLARAHALVLPSLGENYGYVVAEALEAGRPALVSNETPWHDLQGARAGWTLPLTLDAWRTAIGELRALPDEAYQAWCLGARAHGLAASPTDAAAEATLDVLRQASCGTPLSR